MPFDDRIMYSWKWYNNVVCIQLYNVGYVYNWCMFLYMYFLTKYKIMHWIIYFSVEMYMYTKLLNVITSLHYTVYIDTKAVLSPTRRYIEIPLYYIQWKVLNIGLFFVQNFVIQFITLVVINYHFHDPSFCYPHLNFHLNIISRVNFLGTHWVVR